MRRSETNPLQYDEFVVKHGEKKEIDEDTELIEDFHFATTIEMFEDCDI